jgi:RimJ/RimL family protein N-acetyltransferase
MLREVHIAPLTRAHHAALSGLLRDADALEMLLRSAPPTPELVEEALAIVEAERAGQLRYAFAISAPGQRPELVGLCRIERHPQWPFIAEIGYCIAAGFRGRGYATVGAALALRHGFLHQDIEIMRARCSLHNLASVRVLEKLGFRLRDEGGAADLFAPTTRPRPPAASFQLLKSEFPFLSSDPS